MTIRVSMNGRGPEYAWLLECTITDLAGCWLTVICNTYPCQRLSNWSFRLLAEHYNPHLDLSFVLSKLSCSECHSKPTSAVLRQSLTMRKDGGPNGWGIRVYPDLLILPEFRQPYLPLTERDRV